MKHQIHESQVRTSLKAAYFTGNTVLLSKLCLPGRDFAAENRYLTGTKASETYQVLSSQRG